MHLPKKKGVAKENHEGLFFHSRKRPGNGKQLQNIS